MTHARASLLTRITVGTRTIVLGNAVQTQSAIETWRGPAFVPVGLTPDARITVDAITSVRAVYEKKKKNMG